MSARGTLLKRAVSAAAASILGSVAVTASATATTVDYRYEEDGSPPGWYLSIVGDPGADAIGLSFYDGEFFIGDTDAVTVDQETSFTKRQLPTVSPEPGPCRQDKPNQVACRFEAPPDAIVILGFGGDDYISSALRPYSGQGPTSIYGGAGNDSLAGGNGIDHLHGADGNDSLLGFPGDDEIEGGAGSDSLDGGRGDDDLGWYGSSERGRDRFFGNQGRDRIDATHDRAKSPEASADQAIGCGAGEDLVVLDRLDPQPRYCEEVRRS